MSKGWALGLFVAATLAATSVPTVAHADKLGPCPQKATAIMPENPIKHVNCRLTDNSGNTFELDYFDPGTESASSPLSVQIKVKDASGTETQRINELLEVTSPAPPGLQDVDGDGREDLMIPIAIRIMNGAPNTRFSVWRAEMGKRHYERIQMFGQALYPSGDGYFVVNSGALTSRDLDYYIPTAAGFTHVMSLTISAEEIDQNTGEVRTVRCRGHQQSGLGAIDMSFEDAVPFFCNGPAAKAIWPGAERIDDRVWSRDRPNGW